MKVLDNPWRGDEARSMPLPGIPLPSTNSAAPMALLKQCPAAAETPMHFSAELAQRCGVASVWLKDERARMGLGSFKALGAAYVIAHDAAEVSSSLDSSEELRRSALADRHYVTASAGNHGLSVAAGARIFGARATVFLSRAVPPAFAKRLREQGADVRIEGADYAASMQAAVDFSEAQGAVLLSDSSWPGYTELPRRLMEGYTVLAEEIAAQSSTVPTHVFLQAGVGGLAAATAAVLRERWGEAPRMVVVEPEAAPALYESIAAGAPVDTEGPESNMGRLDCKAPSLIALRGLARDADQFMLISDGEASRAVEVARELGLASTPSGLAALAALLQADAATRARLQLDEHARVLLIVSEDDA